LRVQGAVLYLSLQDLSGFKFLNIPQEKSKRFIDDGFEVALYGKPRQRTYDRNLDGDAEARLIAMCCSEPPEGHATWSLRLLADKMVELQCVDSISHETVRRVLKKTN